MRPFVGQESSMASQGHPPPDAQERLTNTTNMRVPSPHWPRSDTSVRPAPLEPLLAPTGAQRAPSGPSSSPPFRSSPNYLPPDAYLSMLLGWRAQDSNIHRNGISDFTRCPPPTENARLMPARYVPVQNSSPWNRVWARWRGCATHP
eukprot:2981836-Pyramimonas_sp.AAC.1